MKRHPNRNRVAVLFVLAVGWAAWPLFTPLLHSIAAEDTSDETAAANGSPAAFRTDADPDSDLPWFQLVDGEFPPEGSAHAFSGELIDVDHLERRFVLRVDRTDNQRRSHFDLPVESTMLPYGSIWYHGAPAALADIPLGTHLHGLFYEKDPQDPTSTVEGRHNRKSTEIDFTRCFRLEDDFSRCRRLGQSWQIESVDLKEKLLSVRLVGEDGGVGESQTFDLQSSTRVWNGRQVVGPEDLSEGQEVLMNITWATLYGPGRVLEIWIDEESRQLATDHQSRKHHEHVRERGLPGWVDEVDNHQRIVTVTFFGNVDPVLFEELRQGDQAGVAVAKRNLQTYDPVNDRKRGPILEVNRVPEAPGSSGVQIKIRPDLMLEGYRPDRIVRVYPSAWPVIALPLEQQYFGRD